MTSVLVLYFFQMSFDTDAYIEQLQADLADVRAAIKLAESQQEYNLDDGQARQGVKRGSLATLYAERQRIVDELISLGCDGESQVFQGRVN